MEKMNSSDHREQQYLFPLIAKAALFLISGLCPPLGLFLGLLAGRSGYQDSVGTAHTILLVSGAAFFIWAGVLILFLFFSGISLIL